MPTVYMLIIFIDINLNSYVRHFPSLEKLLVFSCQVASCDFYFERGRRGSSNSNI